MRVRIVSRLVYVGHDWPRAWRWRAMLIDPADDGGPVEEIIHVGEWATWEEALRHGITAWRFANMRWRAGPGLGESIEIVR